MISQQEYDAIVQCEELRFTSERLSGLSHRAGGLTLAWDTRTLRNQIDHEYFVLLRELRSVGYLVTMTPWETLLSLKDTDYSKGFLEGTQS